MISIYHRFTQPGWDGNVLVSACNLQLKINRQVEGEEFCFKNASQFTPKNHIGTGQENWNENWTKPWIKTIQGQSPG